METFSALLALCAGNSPVPENSPHKGQWRGALMFSLIFAWINDWVNNREAGDLRRYRGNYDVNVMKDALNDMTHWPWPFDTADGDGVVEVASIATQTSCTLFFPKNKASAQFSSMQLSCIWVLSRWSGNIVMLHVCIKSSLSHLNKWP